MKNHFWQYVGTPLNVKYIEAETLADALQAAYSTNDFNFYQNCWFIDAKDRFRIFKFDNRIYIAKKTRTQKAAQEIANAQSAYQKIDGTSINDKTLDVIVPIMVPLEPNSEYCYVVSEYLGSDMNEAAYTEQATNLPLDECIDILELLLNKGIVYRGYLPRNMVVKDNRIFLIDWEDTTFIDHPSQEAFDHLCRTNFLLNWSYLYPYSTTSAKLDTLVGVVDQLPEPPLVEYEVTFKKMTDKDAPTRLLRKNIDTVVFKAELPIPYSYPHFYIRPNDMGHLMADTYPSNIEVLFDVLSYAFRTHNESQFTQHLHLITNLFIAYHKEALGKKQQGSPLIQYYALIPILMMADAYLSNEAYTEILSKKTLSSMVIAIARNYEKDSLVNKYINGTLRGSEEEIMTILTSKLAEACLDVPFNPDTECIKNAVAYILSESQNTNQ